MLKNGRDRSFFDLLVLLILSASALAVLLASLGFGIYERQNYLASSVREFTALADTLGANTAASLAFNDQATERCWARSRPSLTSSTLDCEPPCPYLVARCALQFGGCVIGRQGHAEVISLNLIASVFL